MLSQSTQQSMIKVFQDALKQNELDGGNLLLLHKGEEIFYYEAGYADQIHKKPVARNTVFRWYSMSKPITATAIMLLMERGLIDLFDPVSQFLTGFKNQMVNQDGKNVAVNRDVNILDLLSMTSGLVYGGNHITGVETEKLLRQVNEGIEAGKPMNTQTFANKLGEIPLLFQPGTSWEYGLSADVLGAVIEVVDGRSFGAFLKEEIFEPLGMVDTGFRLTEEQQNRLTSIDTGNNLGIYVDRPIEFESGGAGLMGTIDDYSHFASMLIGHGTYRGTQILKEETVKFMTNRILSKEQQQSFENWHTLVGHSYGHLMRVVNEPQKAGFFTRQGEYGWDGWLGCYMANMPNEAFTFLFMMQRVNSGTVSLTRKLRNLVLADGLI